MWNRNQRHRLPRIVRGSGLVLLGLAALALGAAAGIAGADLAAGTVPAAAQRDAEAVEIARSVLERMGGQQAWEETRHIRWDFFGRRLLYWDKWTGDVRIHSPAREDDPQTERDDSAPERLWLMNVQEVEGRAWEGGREITEPEALQEALVRGRQIWVNDSYWMFMPYKLLDPGVNLEYVGEGETASGEPADVLRLTFDEGVGYTPQNKYRVYVAEDSGLVEQWDYFETAADEEPSITTPWAGWERFGDILLATSRGQGADWRIAVFDELPESVYTDPELQELP